MLEYPLRSSSVAVAVALLGAVASFPFLFLGSDDALLLRQQPIGKPGDREERGSSSW